MSDTHSLFENIKQKIGQLQHQRDDWKTKASSLEVNNKQLTAKLEQLQDEKDQLRSEQATLKMAKSLNKGEVKNTEAKLKINELVKEIDRCIALLSK